MRSLALTALVVALGYATAADAPPAEGVAATVNGQPIPLADLDAAVAADLRNVPVTLAQQRQLRAAVLDDFIDDALVRQFLAKHGPKVDPEEVEAQVKALTARLAKENRTLAAYLKERGQTEAQLRDAYQTQIQFAAYVKEQVTDEHLKAYHAAHRDHFDKVEVRLSHVMLRAPKGAPAAARAAVREKLQVVRADVAAGRLDFADAAKRFSQCPSAKAGGDLGFVPRRGLPEDEPIAKAAFALKVGELSGVVESDYGFHLLLVTDRKPGTPSVLEKCAFEVLEAYTDDFRLDLVKKLRKEAQIKVTLP
ncbi:-type peptidyl-prolyl cis-trans isomerase : Parvulin-like peptidyl-prolyl isomerase OS=Singulisphaera acidiphila (strain ATCC BAA-1392 / DSM 18658 / VKM B-2454 / MOB10) GN=Sinac_0971 PE=4 SV=1: SurA_N_3: Rotamase [Gemmataceae bacterium]|nr:-type peptidyl-prolyl cis-trans isomerase : Parvulin-like peptidyl-prolyl isomerase OS=Singulisphaera acidiphila (strain ATCC BAA-1392 / DSM 18658 / VKM B-2454 / MOB10) GN=Sinac_0971 PE=4 SV=1: SurA_N_3: Rotamase [Gemmataceae bacterium]VTU01777.1 -type peptidyl-prolyl cis-trans isomerase : Parvulin-like peptidyl-prolyl isomerase OS=Singulisphaera acidiphila (strain ATCC BAA-1392 / DSM 18658 / VKM B-2454 / MOB10) GN=Sinac_0971 PE=4 SV=1: SurA_N_3: Rotamase [Gemmataceae bacterium]